MTLINVPWLGYQMEFLMKFKQELTLCYDTVRQMSLSLPGKVGVAKCGEFYLKIFVLQKECKFCILYSVWMSLLYQGYSFLKISDIQVSIISETRYHFNQTTPYIPTIEWRKQMYTILIILKQISFFLCEG